LSKLFWQDQDQDQVFYFQDQDQDSGSQDQDQEGDFIFCPRGASRPRLLSRGLHHWNCILDIFHNHKCLTSGKILGVFWACGASKNVNVIIIIMMMIIINPRRQAITGKEIFW